MAWWNEYKGKYRLRCEVDQRTNDYPREKVDDNGEEKGKYLDTDVYISCAYGRVYWYSRGVFCAWVGTFDNSSRNGKFKNIKKKLGKDMFNIIEGEGENSFCFKKEHLDKVVRLMGGGYKTKIDRSPFSVKNLELEDYEIPEDDLNELKSIGIEMKDYRTLYSKFSEQLGFDKDSFKKELRTNQLKAKEYFHKSGKWDEFLEFAKQWVG